MSRSKRNKKKNQAKADLNIDPVLAEMNDCFAACGRCSYFWAGYRVIVGEEGSVTAAKGEDPVWMNLVWSHPMRDLFSKSYGMRFDVEYFHHEGCCPECRRQFVYHDPGEEQPAQVKIERVPCAQESE